MTIQFTAPVAWVGVTCVFEQSNDNTNWVNLMLSDVSVGGNTGGLASTTAVGIFGGECPARYVRVRVSAYTSGTIHGIVEFDGIPLRNYFVQSNIIQVAGTAVDTNSGSKSGGTLRVTLATDQVQLTNALKVDGSAVTQPVSGTLGITANSSINLNQVAGTAADTAAGNSSAGTLRVVIATNQATIPVSVGSAVTTSGARIEDNAATTGDGGVFILAVRNDAAAVTTSTDADYSQISVDSAGRVGISDLGGSITVDGTVTAAAASGASALANVASSATNVTLLASNASRKAAVIYNDSTQTLYLKFGATASATSFTYFVAAGATLELPVAGRVIYTGIIDGLWASANGNARTTELT